ncbi:MAG TPA: hypothetical protein DCQ90_04600 [Erysipelotrichaceae bacterium]|nr:hypothetical protein [Erysipelotrichaceae bacterium]HAO61219.1 hypothetical protein [Erysipelotrichaceae bacterium]
MSDFIQYMYLFIALWGVLLIGLTFLEIHLAMRKEKYVGLVLPLVDFLLAVILTMMVPFLFPIWFILVFAIPAIEQTIIYYVCRKIVNEKKTELERMQLTDF